MQSVLDSRANDVLGFAIFFPKKFQNKLLHSSHKISDNLILVIYRNFQIIFFPKFSSSSPKITDDLFLVICYWDLSLRVKHDA